MDAQGVIAEGDRVQGDGRMSTQDHLLALRFTLYWEIDPIHR